ncbi:MAG: hypothetical protein ACOVOR_01410 [Rhabdochlamydiaceae bacterium]
MLNIFLFLFLIWFFPSFAYSIEYKKQNLPDSTPFLLKDLDCQLFFFPKEIDEEQYFLISLKPLSKTEVIEQNFYFYFDISSEKAKENFDSYKVLLKNVLPCIKDHNRFNLVLFDQKEHFFKEETVFFSTKNQQELSRFLDDFKPAIPVSGTFSFNDKLYASLRNWSQNKKGHVFIFSDRLSFDKHTKSPQLSDDEGKKICENLSIYLINSGLSLKDKEKNLFAHLCFLSKGDFIKARTFTTLTGKMKTKIRRRSHLLLTNINFSYISYSLSEPINLYVPEKQGSSFYYLDEYFMIGSMKNWQNWNLCVDGYIGNQKLQIEKKMIKTQALPLKEKHKKMFSLFKKNRSDFSHVGLQPLKQESTS